MPAKNRTKSTFANITQPGTLWRCKSIDNWAMSGNVKYGWQDGFVVSEGDNIIVLEVVQVDPAVEKFVVCYSQWQGRQFSTQISKMRTLYEKIS